MREECSGRGTTRAEDAQRTPTQNHISPSILVYGDKYATVKGNNSLEFRFQGLRIGFEGLRLRV